jgi:hypothetical protein
MDRDLRTPHRDLVNQEPELVPRDRAVVREEVIANLLLELVYRLHRPPTCVVAREPSLRSA